MVMPNNLIFIDYIRSMPRLYICGENALLHPYDNPVIYYTPYRKYQAGIEV